MTAKERVIAALEQRPTDRPPIFPVVTFEPLIKVMGKTLADAWIDPQLMYDALYAGWETFGFDGFEIPVWGYKKRDWVEEDGILYLLNEDGSKKYYFTDPNQNPVKVDRTKRVMSYEEILGRPIKTCDELLAEGNFEQARELVSKIDGRAFLTGHSADQTFNSLVGCRGAENALMDPFDEPELVHRAFEHFTLQSIEKAKAFKEIGMDGIYIGDAWSSCSCISPDIFEEFCVPYYRMAADAIHEMGLKACLHICGNTTPILEMMAATGVDSLEPLDPLGGVKLEDVKDRLGGTVGLKGGINTLTVLNGTVQQVVEETQSCLDLMGTVPGYIFSAGDDIPPHSSIENIMAMCDTVRNYRNPLYDGI